MANENTDFLKFSAYSIKEYITRKLSENSRFTDQVYEGSNLAVLIDVVSYMYQCMMYQLNNAASEAMWSDTQIYENISRLAKILGYSPRGIKPSSGVFVIDNQDDDGSSGKYADITIPRYACIDTGIIDADGNSVYYSTNQEFSIDRGQKIIEQRFYNGKWKMYSTIFTATGDDYETFILTGVGSDIENKKYAANDFIDVYVESTNSEGEQVITKWDMTQDELYSSSLSSSYGMIYDNSQEIYNLRLNENKDYEIKFGDGVLGKKLTSGDRIYIFYLETNGLMGKVEIGDLPADGVQLKHSPQLFGITDELYNQLFVGTEADQVDNENIMVFQNLPTSTAQEEESVDEIRENAPTNFKLGKRLITEQDYRYYIMNINGNSDIIDVQIQNNWQYITVFYKWLYNLGIKNHDNERYYLNQNRIVKSSYKFADAADAKNIYVWTKLQYGDVDDFSELIQDKISKIKSLTTEVVFLAPITVYFAISAAPEDRVLEYIYSDGDFDELSETYIEITLDNNSLYITSEVQTRIADIISNYFNERDLKLGQTVKYQDIVSQIYEINGINRIRTVYQKKTSDGEVDQTEAAVIKDGLSFATWSEGGVIDEGDDVEVSNIMKSLEVFQFPQLSTADIKSKIKVIKKSINNINNISY